MWIESRLTTGWPVLKSKIPSGSKASKSTTTAMFILQRRGGTMGRRGSNDKRVWGSRRSLNTWCWISAVEWDWFSYVLPWCPRSRTEGGGPVFESSKLLPSEEISSKDVDLWVEVSEPTGSINDMSQKDGRLATRNWERSSFKKQQEKQWREWSVHVKLQKWMITKGHREVKVHGNNPQKNRPHIFLWYHQGELRKKMRRILPWRSLKMPEACQLLLQ